MDKTSEKILKFSLSETTNEKIFVESSVVKEYFNKLSNKEFDLSIKHLADNGYIEVKHTSFGTIYIPQHKGYCYFELKRNEQIKSILTPTIVSVLTTLIMFLLQWLLPLTLKWFSNFLS